MVDDRSTQTAFGTVYEKYLIRTRPERHTLWVPIKRPIVKLSAAHISSFPNVQVTFGKAIRAGRDNKYAQAAREIAAVDLSLVQLTGPPLNARGLHRGFLDVLA